MKEIERLKLQMYYFFTELHKKVFKLEETKFGIEKKKKNWICIKKGRHLEKHQDDLFFEKQMVSKKRGDTELECKTGVKHNSKFQKIHFQK